MVEIWQGNRDKKLFLVKTGLGKVGCCNRLLGLLPVSVFTNDLEDARDCSY